MKMIRKVEGHDDIVVARNGDQIYAFSYYCTHSPTVPMFAGYVEGCQVVCGFHWAAFDMRDGSVLEGPATEPIPVYEVKIEGDDVLVAMPEKSVTSPQA